MIDKRWETKPCTCNIDPNTEKPRPFTDPCKSLTIPGVFYQPLDPDLVTKIVEDHNTMLDIRVLHKGLPNSPFEGYGLNL